MSTLSESAFLELAETTLGQLEVAIERAADHADIDLELSRNGNVLELEFDNGSKIIINSQAAMQEIWVAARAGGFHFRPQQTGDHVCWVDTRGGSELYAALTAYISQQAEAVVQLGAVAD